MAFLEAADLDPFASIDATKAEAMIADAEALAVQAAPCLATPAELDDAQVAAVKAVLRGAVLRWNESGSSGAVTQQTAGPFSQTVSQPQRRGMFWPSELEQLQEICGGSDTSGIFAVDTAPSVTTGIHADICSINFGSEYCSCGAVLTGLFPLYET